MSNKNSPIGYGSKFQSLLTLAPLLKLHPHWENFERLIEEGSSWPLVDIKNEEREKDVSKALKFGNHKGAKLNDELLKLLIKEDVTHGFILPLPLHKINRILGILLAPLNIICQNTINERGEIVEKDRLTHDQSFIFDGSGTSVDSRLNKSKLTPCTFGWVIRRLVNWIVAARNKYPNQRILVAKIDFKSAYRQCHLNHATAVQCCASLPNEDLALLALCLTFGGAACPFEWSIILETICNLATAITQDKRWEHEKNNLTYSEFNTSSNFSS
jgi:hypothetical protein